MDKKQKRKYSGGLMSKWYRDEIISGIKKALKGAMVNGGDDPKQRLQAFIEKCKDPEIIRQTQMLIENAEKYIEKNGRPLTMADVKILYGLSFTVDHNGKMRGMQSISTCCLCNPFCLARILAGAEGTICPHCFAADMLKNKRMGIDSFIYNTYLLTSFELPIRILPVINALIFRIESFGDISNKNQQTNYLNLARKNPDVQFTQWTKNPGITSQAIKEIGKPENMILIYSVSKLNDETKTIEIVQRKWPFIDKTFTVFTKEYIKEHNIDINCGARSCLNCKRCYKKSSDSTIREQLK